MSNSSTGRTSANSVSATPRSSRPSRRARRSECPRRPWGPPGSSLWYVIGITYTAETSWSDTRDRRSVTLVPTAAMSATVTIEMRPRISTYSTRACPASRSRRARRLMKKLFIATICYLPPVWISGPGCVAAARPLSAPGRPRRTSTPSVAPSRIGCGSTPDSPPPRVAPSEPYRARNQTGTADRVAGTGLSGESRAAPPRAVLADEDDVAPVELPPGARREQPLRHLLLARRIAHEQAVAARDASRPLDAKPELDDVLQLLCGQELEATVERNPAAKLGVVEDQPVGVALVREDAQARVLLGDPRDGARRGRREVTRVPARRVRERADDDPRADERRR